MPIDLRSWEEVQNYVTNPEDLAELDEKAIRKIFDAGEYLSVEDLWEYTIEHPQNQHVAHHPV